MAGMIEIAKQELSGLFGFGEKKKENFIDRDQIAEWCKNFCASANSILNSLGKEPIDVLNYCRDNFEKNYSSSKYKEVSYWKDYVKSLNSKASNIESRCFMASVFEVLKIYVKTIKEVEKQITYIFPDELTNVKDLRKSQAAVLGALDRGTTVNNWAVYMFTLLVNVSQGYDENIPRYRLDFIANNTKLVIEITNILIQQGDMDLVGYAKYLRGKGLDDKLTSNGVLNNKFITLPIIGTLGVMATILGGIGLILTIRWFIRYSQEHMEMRNHTEYLKSKEMEEWLEAHTARLRMELNGTNPNDPQYQKMLKIIDTYDEKIRDLDEEINKYLNS